MRIAISGLLLSLASVLSQAHADGEFVLTIDGQPQEFSLEQERAVTLSDGKVVKLKLSRKDFVIFKGLGFQFEHPGTLTVASKEIDQGLWQNFLSTAEGTMVMVQSYEDVDTTALIDLMMGKLTDDDVSAGASRNIQPTTRKLADGSEIAGKSASLKAPGDDVTVEVLAKKQGRGGVILMTRHDRNTSPQDASLIERFWSSLKLD